MHPLIVFHLADTF
jgi:pSer/pThr/pTyr-binding forkhead associated (FHA) protein